MESASAMIVKRHLGTKRAIRSRRATHDRQFVRVTRARCEKKEANNKCVSWGGLSRMTAAILAANLVVGSPEMPYVWTVAHAENFQTPEELRSAAIERRRELLSAARERVLREGAMEKGTDGDMAKEESRTAEESRLELLTESVKKQQKKYDEEISKSQKDLPRTSGEKGFAFPSLPKFSTPDLPKPSVPDMPKFSAPSLPNFSAPDLPKPSVPDMPKFSAPSLPKFSAPDLPKPSVPDMPKFSAPSLPKFSAPSLPKFSAPSLPKFSAPDLPKQQGLLENGKNESPAQEQSPARQQTPPFKTKEPSSLSSITKKSESLENPSRIVEGKGSQLPEVPPRGPSSLPSDSILDLMRKKYSSESSQTVPVPQSPKPSSGTEQSLSSSFSRGKLQSMPSEKPRKDTLRSNREKRIIQTKPVKKRGPLPLWLAQFLMLAVLGGCIYSLTVLYRTTNKILVGAYNTVDRFLLGLRFSYDRTDKKDVTRS